MAIMTFGISNVTSNFMFFMNHIFKPFIARFEAVYFDDIRLYNVSIEEHLEHFHQVLQTLKEQKLFF
jgi:hypothetical protein